MMASIKSVEGPQRGAGVPAREAPSSNTARKRAPQRPGEGLMSASSSKRRFRIGVLALAGIAMLVLAPTVPVLAQVGNAAVEVLVTDQQDQPLPGVTVRVVNRASGLERVSTSNEDGLARLAALPPGTYELHCTLAGFTPVVEENLVLRVGQTARVRAVMQEASKEAITVTAQAPLVDVYKMDSSSNIVPEQIQQLPVPNRDFQRLAFITPGVTRERGQFRFINNGPVLGSGNNASQATILVDGVDLTDPALGLARARFSQDAIQEFRVINDRFDTEIGQSAGGAMSIVTKSGGNELTGTVFAFYRSDSLRSRTKFELENPEYTRGQYGFTLGGPIVKDKTHFFVSTEYIKEDNVALFRPQGAFVDLKADVPHNFDQMLGFVSIDHAVTDSQRLTGKLVYERYREDNFRVGGVSDISNGQSLNRDNWNVTVSHVLVPGPNYINELHAQIGSAKYEEPTNSTAVQEWFSSGNTLKTGTNTVGDLLGKSDVWEIRDTAHLYHGASAWKMGVSVQHVKERSRIDNFQNGLLVYYGDDRSFPISYLYGIGSSDVTKSTTLYGAFIQDDWRPRSNLTLSFGVRYDLDTDGNNPDFHHPLVPDGRSRDTNNIQPRFSFNWDPSGNGSTVVRGGFGRFTGRYLLIPAITELQQNGITGRLFVTRVNGLLYGLPAFALDPNNPTTTGLPLKSAITLLARTFDAPQSDQASLGFTQRLGSTGLFFGAEALYVKGTNEIVVRDTNYDGNPLVRPDPTWDQINTYTNEGHSRYKALIFSLNGTLPGGDLITSSLTVSDKRNISDDFSPAFPYGYPSDPTNIEAEWGRSRGDERWRLVVSGIFNLPWDLTVAPIYEYGSGQPWTHRLGYDYNGDGKNSDRPAGVARNAEDGPPFRQFSVRVTKSIHVSGSGRLDLIVEAFNLFNTVNYDVNSIDGAEYLSGPSLLAPTAAYVPNANFGKYSATFPGREVQLGIRYAF